MLVGVEIRITHENRAGESVGLQRREEVRA